MTEFKVGDLIRVFAMSNRLGAVGIPETIGAIQGNLGIILEIIEFPIRDKVYECRVFDIDRKIIIQFPLIAEEMELVE